MYYVLGSFLYLVINIIYYVVRNGGLNLTQAVLTDLVINAAMAGLGFLIANYLLKKRA